MVSTLKLAILPLVLVTAAVLLASAPERAQGGGGDATISIGSGTVTPGGDITVDITITSLTGIVASAGINIIYESSLIQATGCTTTQGVARCDLAYDENTLRLVMVDVVDGLSGVVGAVTFHAIGAAGTTASMQVVVTTCGDPEGSPLKCATRDGAIAIRSQTPSPSPTSTPLPTPTQVPGPTLPPSPSLPPSSTPGLTQPPLLWGDVNCDGFVNSVDALTLMRWSAGLPVLQVQPCPTIGAVYP